MDACIPLDDPQYPPHEPAPWKRKETIGLATLYLADARDVLPSLTWDSVVTDPPFGMAFRSNYRAERHNAIQNDGDDALLKWACSLDAPHSRYVFCRWDNISALPKPKSLITWVKNNWSMGDLEHEHGRQTEVAAFWPGEDHAWPKGRPSDVIHAPRTGNEHHPTEKPVQLMMAICEWTRGTILDPFMGAGSTGIATTRLGRPFIGIEIEERYFDIAVRRIEEAQKQGDLLRDMVPHV